MESSLVGAITASVVCGVFFCVTMVVVCYLVYRCSRQPDEKSSQHETLINGHVRNGIIPTVTHVVPIPVPRPIYQFPTMPVRHMATYRPRYIEEMSPTGLSKMEGQSVVMKSQTYSGPYTSPNKGHVYYDVRQHNAPRSNRSPLWNQRLQGEEVATMNLGEESPKLSERHFSIQRDNKRNSVHSENGHSVVEKQSSRYSDVQIPSPDAERMQYLFTTNEESSKQESTTLSANEIKVEQITSHETTIQNGGVVRKASSRRQRRPEDGYVAGYKLPSVRRYKPSSHRHERHADPEPEDAAVYIAKTNQPLILEDEDYSSQQFQPESQLQQPLQESRAQTQQPFHETQSFEQSTQPIQPIQPTQQSVQDPASDGPVQRYFFNGDVYAMVGKVKSIEEYPEDALHVIGRPVEQPDVDFSPTSRETPASVSSSGIMMKHLADHQKDTTDNGKALHHVDYRVIKSKRRPSWLQNAGQWFSKGRKSK